DGDNFGQVFKAILVTTPLPLADVPPDIEELVGRMLQKDRNARCPDLREVATVLRRYSPSDALPFGEPSSDIQSSPFSAPETQSAPFSAELQSFQFSAEAPP